jgi:hypothetical protein
MNWERKRRLVLHPSQQDNGRRKMSTAPIRTTQHDKKPSATGINSVMLSVMKSEHTYLRM